ncbi:hypothetical protein [Streptomyces sp. NBC_01602]|uniref:hypothetical protein n=1 Tax=Streptomyces sp. NBC_01602 TaxID=2975893 RepID=UPI0038689E2D
MPGAVVTVIGLLGLRVFSRLVVLRLIASNTVTYGPVGIVLVIKSWLVGVGVVFGGTLAGRLLTRNSHAWRTHRNAAEEAQPRSCLPPAAAPAALLFRLGDIERWASTGPKPPPIPPICRRMVHRRDGPGDLP